MHDRHRARADRPLLAVVLTVLLALVLAACSGSSGPDGPGGTDPADEPQEDSALVAPEETPTVDPGPRPEVGECHALTWRQALSPVARTKPVRCRRNHTAQTFSVGTLDLRIGSENRDVDSPPVQERVRRRCTTRLPRHLGSTPRELRLTMAQVVWFTPTVEKAAAGADWFRCDVVVVAGRKSLLRLPGRTKGWGRAPAIAMCGTAEPGTKGFRRIPCAQPHSWVAVSTVDLPGQRLPPAGQVADRMDPVCRDAARARAGDPLDFSWSQESPSRDQWRAGQRYGICWAPA